MSRRTIIMTWTILWLSLFNDFNHSCVLHSRVKNVLLTSWDSDWSRMTLRMTIEAQIILLQSLCDMRYFKNLNNINSLYQNESSDERLIQTVTNFLFEKNCQDDTYEITKTAQHV